MLRPGCAPTVVAMQSKRSGSSKTSGSRLAPARNSITMAPRGTATPVVALTANAYEDDRRACLEAGMNDFLTKPIEPGALRAALARWTSPPGEAKLAS